MTKPYSDYIKPKTRNLLWAVSAGRCQICNDPVWKDWFTKTRGNFGEVAHIIGNRLDIPGREKAILPPEYCNDVNNLMLLCPTHHQLIDYEKPEDFPSEKLRIIKEIHEDRIEKITGAGSKQSHLVKYCANIDIHQSLISDSDAIIAMALNGWYPNNDKAIKLGIEHSISRDNVADYWYQQINELVGQFKSKVLPYINSSVETHFSVFGFAPIPLLIKLGSLFSDKNLVEVYQFHREPEQNWIWQKGPDIFEYIVKEPKSIEDTVALIIAFSDHVVEDRIAKVLGDSKVSIWTLTIKDPDKDFLKSREQLSKFRETIRNLLGKIKSKHPNATLIHLFPAIGVAPAIEIGRVWQPKADLPLVIYDENKALGGFIRTITIS